MIESLQVGRFGIELLLADDGYSALQANAET